MDKDEWMRLLGLRVPKRHMSLLVPADRQRYEIAKLDKIRREGYRPVVVAALTCGGLIGLFGSWEYPGYEFLQGGIEPDETPAAAIERELREELGDIFYLDCAFPDQPEFLFQRRFDMRVKDKIMTSDGQTIEPRGKHYLVFSVALTDGIPPEIQFEMIPDCAFRIHGGSIQFTSYMWEDLRGAMSRVQTIQSERKRQLLVDTIRELNQLGLVKTIPLPAGPMRSVEEIRAASEEAGRRLEENIRYIEEHCVNLGNGNFQFCC